MKIKIVKKARYHDDAKGETKDEFLFRKTNGSLGRIRMSVSTAQNPKELRRQLVDAGALLPKTTADLQLLLQDLISAEPSKEVRYAKKAGWQNGNRTFIRLNHGVGYRSEAYAGVSPSRHSTGFPPPEYKGSLTSWRSQVAKIAGESSVAMLAVSAAFASPLLNFINFPSFGLCIYAPSRSGKTAITLAAASVIGCGSSEQIITWNTTIKALEQSFALSNDCLLPIDDLSGKAGSPKALYQALRERAHLIASGYGTSRHSTHEINAGVGHDKWRSIAITSREDSIAKLARSLRKEREIGEAVRLIDVPALLPGQTHIFDRGQMSSLEMQKVMSRLGDLYKACQENHGHVFAEYISRLVRNRKTLGSKVDAIRQSFEREVVSEDDDRIARDLATKFGIIYAGGILAIRFKLVPWSEKDLLNAISQSFSQAKSEFPDPTAVLKRGLRKLSTVLDSLARKKTIKPSAFKSSRGYRTQTSRTTGFVVLKQAFSDAFESNEQAIRVQDFLLAKKFMKTKKAKSGRNFVSPKDQVMWPDQRRRRSYQLSFPGKDWKSLMKVSS